METREASGRLAMPIDSLEQVGIRRGHEGMPLMTALGLIGGDVLTYLDDHGVAQLDELSQRIDWPRWMTLMGRRGSRAPGPSAGHAADRWRGY